MSEISPNGFCSGCLSTSAGLAGGAAGSVNVMDPGENSGN